MKQSIAQLIEEDYLVKPQTGKIILNGTGIEIDLPENVMFIDHGINTEWVERHSRDYDPGGTSTLTYSPHENQTVLAQLGRVECPYLIADIFTQGHEEGHVLQNLGQQTKLESEARKLGFKIPLFNKPEVINLEAKARLAFETKNRRIFQEYFDLLENTSAESKESIANVGGLVALAKQYGDHELIRGLYQPVKKGDLKQADAFLSEYQSNLLKHSPKKDKPTTVQRIKSLLCFLTRGND